MNSSNKNYQKNSSADELKCFSEIANCVIPPTSQFPGGGEIDTFNLRNCKIEFSAEQKNHSKKILEETEKLSRKIFDSNFINLTQVNKILILKNIESNQTNIFKSIIHIIYSQYYSNPAVIKLKKLPEKPFQPEGFKLKPFDQTSINNVMSRGKKYID